MPPIKIPRVPPSAYNPDRPANDLLLAQVRELAKAVRAAGRQVRLATPRTEGEVAAHIRQLNRALHHQVLLPAIKRRPVRAPTKQAVKTRASAKRKAVRAATRSRAARKRGAKR